MALAHLLLPESVAVALPGKGSNSHRNKFLGLLLACLTLSACAGDSSSSGGSGRASAVVLEREHRLRKNPSVNRQSQQYSEYSGYMFSNGWNG